MRYSMAGWLRDDSMIGRIAVAAQVAAAVLMLALLGTPASAQVLPNATTQEVLIKTTLLTFNDANLTGNYDVLHAKLWKPFGDKFTPAKLAVAFKAFRDQHLNLQMIAAMKPISVGEPTIDNKGFMTLKGYFGTTPSRVNYQLGFILSDGKWQPTGINVNVKKPGK